MTESWLLNLLEQFYQADAVQCSLVAHGEKDVLHVQRLIAPDWIVRLYPLTASPPSHDRVYALASLLVLFEREQYPAERVVRTITGALTTQNERCHVLVTTYLGPSLQAWQPATAHETIRTPTHGDPIDRNPLLFFRIGALLGQLHALDCLGTPAEQPMARGLQAAAELAWASTQLDQLKLHVPAHLQEEYVQLCMRIQQVRSFEACPQTIIHGDCHLGNVVGTATTGYRFVDWEAAGCGASVTDLGLLLRSSSDSSDERRNRVIIHAIIDGYRVHRALNQLERDLLADAIRFRILVTLAGAYEYRCQPDYQPTQRFWGSTYAAWEQQEQHAIWIARTAQEHLDRLSVNR